MTNEVMEGIPFGLQFGENPEESECAAIVDDSEFNEDLQLRVDTETDRPTYQVIEELDGRLKFLYPDNRHTRKKTKHYIDGGVSYDITGD